MLLESLEQRRMLTVTANQFGGLLIVQGDADSNVISVAEFNSDAPGGPNYVMVAYSDNSGGGLLSPETGFVGVRAVLIVSGDGDDNVSFSGRGVDSLVTLGRGNDAAYIETLDGSTVILDGGEGAETDISLNAYQDSNILFVGGSGNDSGTATAIDGGRIDIEAGSGDDTGWALNAQGDSSYISFEGGSGNDQATLLTVGAGSRTDVSGGNGNDSFTLVSSEDATTDLADARVNIDGGNGSDTIEVAMLGQQVGGEIRVNAGAGADTVSIGATLTPSANVVANGGSGFDVLVSAISPADPRLTASRFEA